MSGRLGTFVMYYNLQGEEETLEVPNQEVVVEETESSDINEPKGFEPQV